MLMTKEASMPILDNALDAARKLLGVETDEKLASELGVSSKTICFLRTGRWTKVDDALIRVLVTALSDKVPSKNSTFGY